jgi:hypothetical protein
MMNPMLSSTIDRILKVMVICLLLLLIGFEMVPINSIRDTQQYIVQAGFQRARRCAYMLRYRPHAEHAQAIKELQIVLPLFQQEQALLLTNSAPEIQFLLQAAQTDYRSIVAAVHVLIVHPATPIELAILLVHDRGFFSKMDAVVLLLEQRLEARNAQLLSIRVLMISACIVCKSVIIVLVMVRIRRHLRMKKMSQVDPLSLSGTAPSRVLKENR